MGYFIRQATVADVKTIHGFLLSGAEKGLLLSRPLYQLYLHIRDFIVLVDATGAIRGCTAISVVWEDLAEVRSLYVDEDLRGTGLGRMLVESSMELARKLGVKRFFTLTYVPGFFGSLGFAEVNKDVLPQKIWVDCIHCPKFPDCDEIAMLKVPEE